MENRMRALYATHAPPLRRYLRRLTSGDPELAEDLLQETMLRAWRHLDGLPDGDEQLRRWLFTVARNNTVDDARARLARPREVAPDDLARFPAQGRATDEVEAAATVRRVLPRLSRDHLTVVVGLYYRDLSAPEVARCLGIPEGTVKSRAHHALRRLRTAIGSI